MSKPLLHAHPRALRRSIKPQTRLVDDARLALARALTDAGESAESVAFQVDRCLLVALAAELLGVPGARSAPLAAGAGDFATMARLVLRVEELTGLHLGSETLARLIPGRSLQATLPFDLFGPWREEDDPIASLAQLLRSRGLQHKDGRWRLEPSELRRDQGGYYTPYRLARRLVSRLIPDDFEKIPTVIDPSCGAGTFLLAAFDVVHGILAARRAADPSLVVSPVAWTIAALHGVDIDPGALSAARLSLAVRAVQAERSVDGRGQMALFGQAQTYGPLIEDRLRLGDALLEAPHDSLPGTERLRRRLLARDEPGRLPSTPTVEAVQWDADFPLRFSDEEGTWKDAGGFDLVVTNPPFVPVDRIPPELRARLKKSLTTAQKRFDLFIGFVERATSLLTPGGRATLLIPRTFLTEANAENCRHMLLDQVTVERIEEIGPVAFEGAKVDCIALSFIARRPTDTCAVEIYRRGQRQPTAVPLLSFRRAPRRMMRLELSEPAAAECLRLAEKSIPLGRYFCAAWGARGSPVKDFHLDDDSHPLAKPMLKGSDVEPFHAAQPTRWLLYDKEKLYRPSRREFFEHSKLVVRKVTGARGLVIAVDEDHHYSDDSIACVVRKADLISVPVADRKRHKLSIAPNQIEPSRAYDLHLVCALLQTPLVQTYYRVQLGGGLNVFPEQIEALPLPKPAALDSDAARELATLGREAAKGNGFNPAHADALARVLYGLV